MLHGSAYSDARANSSTDMSHLVLYVHSAAHIYLRVLERQWRSIQKFVQEKSKQAMKQVLVSKTRMREGDAAAGIGTLAHREDMRWDATKMASKSIPRAVFAQASIMDCYRGDRKIITQVGSVLTGINIMVWLALS